MIQSDLHSDMQEASAASAGARDRCDVGIDRNKKNGPKVLGKPAALVKSGHMLERLRISGYSPQIDRGSDNPRSADNQQERSIARAIEILRDLTPDADRGR
jgi:hypothetical protein